MAIVAEVEEGGQRTLIGVGRLVADPNHDTAEYAALVADRWQGQGLGSLLTDYCVEIAISWGLKKIVAETDWDNKRMLATFRRNGFEVVKRSDGVVYAELALAHDSAVIVQ